MKVMACNVSDLNVETGVCSAPMWVDQVSGMSLPDAAYWQAVIPEILGLLAICYVMRLVHNWANSLN